jgi:hypothetical protein
VSCPEYSAHKEQRNYIIRGMGEEEINSFLLANMGCLAKVNMPINKKQKAWTKNIDYVFIGYDFYSVCY